MGSYKVYVSGAITGRERTDVEAEFNAAEDLWRAIGIDVVNPLRNGLDADASWREHMKADIALLLDCQAVHFLPGWELSRGARVEYQMAREAGMDMYIAKDGIVNVDTFNVINGIVSRENILRVLRLTQAIRRVTGVSFEQIKSSCRQQRQFFSRLILAKECRSMMTIPELASLMNTQRHSVRFFLRKFADELRYNREFAGRYAQVLAIINDSNNTNK